MQVIIISPNNTSHKHWHLTPVKQLAIAGMTVLLIAAFSFLTYQWLNSDANHNQNQPSSPVIIATTKLDKQLQKQQFQAYYAKRLGTLEAEAIRLKALAKKLADMSGLDINSAILTSVAGRGGVEDTGVFPDSLDIESGFFDLEEDLQTQSQNLQFLQDYLITEENIKSAIPSGRPTTDGWVSSYYGRRIDPFTGKKVFHHGLDFAGKEGSEVTAVADGMVSWTGKRGGYGELVEIEHGNGYQTRYAHNKSLTVAIGDRIKKGQTIALMGSTGRSTGPHVHFEVLRDGKAVNPYNFVKN
jgi:murein DD-endopeptidase MepM/ murein hydrolase activator NlpD